jgi:RNase P subunit RPR2
MWTKEYEAEFKEHIAKLSDDELIKLVCEDYADYREEALQLAEKELAARGIELEDETEASADKADVTVKVVFCQVCQSPMRSGVLFSGKEVTIFFTDQNEERFVEVHACSKCGQVQMVVDYETDVEN